MYFIHFCSQPSPSFTFLIIFTLFKPYFISTWVLDLAMGLGDVFCPGLQFFILVKLCNKTGERFTLLFFLLSCCINSLFRLRVLYFTITVHSLVHLLLNPRKLHDKSLEGSFQRIHNVDKAIIKDIRLFVGKIWYVKCGPVKLMFGQKNIPSVVGKMNTGKRVLRGPAEAAC